VDACIFMVQASIHDSAAKRSLHREAREDRQEKEKSRIFFKKISANV